MDDTDDYLRRFVDFATEQNMVSGLDPAEVAPSTRRDELGISSLNIILLLANYMKERGASELAFRPEWVARLDVVEGILAVMREVDQAAPRATAAG